MANSTSGSPDYSNSGSSEKYFGPDEQELEYLSELLDEFSVDPTLNPEEALRLVYDRYHSFERNFSRLAKATEEKAKEWPNPGQFYYKLCIAIHGYLYKDILSNAGSFRNINDRNYGIVEFGGLTASGHKSRFRGVAPEKIEVELKSCFEILTPKEPVSTSIFFYLEFSAIHPFYDANGRIARIIVSLYLHNYGYHVNWREIDKTHSKFIKRLNGCHSRRTWPERYNEYKGFLLSYWIKNIELYNNFFGEENE